MAESYDIRSVDRAEVLHYLGYSGQSLSPELDSRIGEVVERCLSVARPRGVTRVFEVAGRESRDGLPVISLSGTALDLVGNSIAAHLEGAVAVGVLAVTAGAPVDAELRRLSLTDRVAEVIMDAAGSALVERAADAAEAILVAQAAERGLYVGSRFSPGYGDLPLLTQPVLLSTLDAGRQLGITLSPTLLMSPMKSVTAVVGLFEEPPEREYVICDECLRREFCELRSAGRYCGRRG
ncbi:MAG TPA: hypothetical protein IAA15_08680 [Candidatus Olsenella pullicola]|nr:hypothetical protein [Candidatus Olsenella pullicola]